MFRGTLASEDIVSFVSSRVSAGLGRTKASTTEADSHQVSRVSFPAAFAEALSCLHVSRVYFPSWNCLWKLALLALNCGPVMQRHLSELPGGTSKAHVTGGGQTFSRGCLTLSFSREVKHKQLSVFGILLCAFFLLSSFIIHPLPLSHKASPQTGNFIQQQIGKKNDLFFFLGGH